jgi:multiple sugar transport system permease protein
MDGIDPNMYEAATLDGASYLKRVFYITIPQLKEMGFIIAIISVLNSFKVFREAYLIAGDYPNKSIYLLQHVFNNWFVNLELGKLFAGAVMLALVVFIFIAGLKKFFVPGDMEG